MWWDRYFWSMAEQQEPQPASQRPSAERSTRGRPFEKGGDDPRQKQNKARAADLLSEEPDGLDEAARMRRVWEQSEGEDCNRAQRHLRAILKDDRKGYHRTMVGLEEKQAAGLLPAGEEAEDAGEERVRRLMGELLRRVGRPRPS